MLEKDDIIMIETSEPLYYSNKSVVFITRIMTMTCTHFVFFFTKCALEYPHSKPT